MSGLFFGFMNVGGPDFVFPIISQTLILENGSDVLLTESGTSLLTES